MPRIIIQADALDGESAGVTLTERVVAANLDSSHYTAQLIERLAWATADAEAIESGRLGCHGAYEATGAPRPWSRPRAPTARHGSHRGRFSHKVNAFSRVLPGEPLN